MRVILYIQNKYTRLGDRIGSEPPFFQSGTVRNVVRVYRLGHIRAGRWRWRGFGFFFFFISINSDFRTRLYEYFRINFGSS